MIRSPLKFIRGAIYSINHCKITNILNKTYKIRYINTLLD